MLPASSFCMYMETYAALTPLRRHRACCHHIGNTDQYGIFKSGVS